MNTTKSTLFAFITIAVTVCFVWSEQQPDAPVQATWGDVLAEAKDGGYRTGHLEGAVNFPMEPTWWSRWRSTTKLEDFWGVDKERYLVFY